MATDQMVNQRINSGYGIVRKLASGGFDVSAAAWLKRSRDEKWDLYVVSTVVGDEGLQAAYGKAGDVIGRPTGALVYEERPTLNLITTSSPLGAALIAARREPRVTPLLTLGWTRVGDLSVEEGYVYPPIPSAASGTVLTPSEVVSTVVALLGHPDPRLPAHVTLQDGGDFLGTAVALERGDAGMLVRFTIAPDTQRVLPVESIQSID